VVALVLGSALLAACATADSAAPEDLGKAGPAPLPHVALTLATNEPPDRPGGQIVTAFVESVKSLSDGAITITPSFEYPTGQTTAWDQKVIAAMQDGTFDLVVAVPGAWESAGAHGMRALQLPGVFVNDDQVDAVTTAPVADDILAGLADVGAVGLGLYPQNLRHLAMYQFDPLSLEGLKGAALRVPLQDTVFDWLTAVGAEPLDLGFPDFTAQANDGTLAGSDLSLFTHSLAPSGGPIAPLFTVNVPLYAKFSVLALSEASASGLSDDVMRVLRAAAQQTLDHTIDTRPREVELALDACTDGVIMRKGEPGTLDDIVGAAQPVINEVASDPVEGPILKAVRAAAGPGTVDQLATCSGNVVVDPSTLTPSAGEFPNGVYRGTVTPEMIAAVGLPARECPNNCGTYTWTMKDGHYSWTVDWPTYPPAGVQANECCWQTQDGVYEVRGDQIMFSVEWLGNADKPFVATLRWVVNPDQSISYEYVSGNPSWDQWFDADIARPRWTRIGDA
jgi:TRAP-type C4-dicarboxylate transport system substrate-binding protein